MQHNGGSELGWQLFLPMPTTQSHSHLVHPESCSAGSQQHHGPAPAARNWADSELGGWRGKAVAHGVKLGMDSGETKQHHPCMGFGVLS